MARSAETILQANTSLAGDLGGVPIVIRKGELIDADHPAVDKWPEAFSPVSVQHRGPTKDAPVEQATAAPGEKRARR